MGLLETVRAGIKIADAVTKDLQATVLYERAIGTDGYGSPLFAPAVPLRAVVDYASKQVRTRDGILTVTRVTLGLLDVEAVVAATSGEGIGNDDRFTLPDGDVAGPVLDVSGFVDRGTGHPVATQVMLG
jgi:hypothetical protein